MKFIIFVSILLLLVGCSKEQKTGKDSEINPDNKSTALTLIDGFTGRTAVRSGQKARATIENVSSNKQQDLEEILGK